MRPAASSRPLVEKVQLKPPVLSAPNVPAKVKPKLKGLRLSSRRPDVVEATIRFAKDRAELERVFALVDGRLGDDAMLWIGSPRGGSGVETDLNRDQGWACVDAAGLVGVGQVAVDEGLVGPALPPAAEEGAAVTIAYTVTAEFDDLAVASEYVRWLEDGHLAEVLRGGAAEATLVRMEPTDGAALRFEVRYRFPSMAAFQRYEAEHAPRLRAEGLAKFPASRGVRMRRSLGEVLLTKVHP